MFPLLSTEIEIPPSSFDPPNLFAKTRFPEASNFETKTSDPPAVVRSVVPAPGSKSTVCSK